MEKDYQQHPFYVSFLKLLDQYKYLQPQIGEQSVTADSENKEGPHAEWQNLYDSAPGMVWLFNHHTLKYEYFSRNVRNILGYEASYFLEGDISRGMEIFHPLHANIFAQSIIPVMLEHYQKMSPLGKIKDLRMIYEAKIRKSDQTYVWIVHHMVVVETDENGNPLKSLIFGTDVNEIKKSEQLGFTILLNNSVTQLQETIYSAQFPVESTLGLTSRELEILLMLGKGSSSVEIAKHLSLSEHTVNTHRRNMLEKTGSKNVAELLHKAMASGLVN